MYMADYLSRNFIVTKNTPNVDLEDIVHTVNEIELKFTDAKEKEFVSATRYDEVLNKVTHLIQHCLPKTQKILRVKLNIILK